MVVYLFLIVILLVIRVFCCYVIKGIYEFSSEKVCEDVFEDIIYVVNGEDVEFFIDVD